ncbi:hypothetical protein FB567DRAFT_334424 [Paraphoma chrysanthemicola]|uniref:RING-type domain-containing protein n=1 Tax=Paraphoma chrysanthemicola TaxID=798071 RepID=A0A8K0R6Q5_9PLEO|nr:hypothetical protein FB567DRAFT_334424 [Paraphoma chrysanthemicola]
MSPLRIVLEKALPSSSHTLLNSGRHVLNKSLRPSPRTIPLPNTNQPDPPRIPPPQHSVPDPGDRLVVSHPTPSSCPSILMPDEDSITDTSDIGTNTASDETATHTADLQRQLKFQTRHAVIPSHKSHHSSTPVFKTKTISKSASSSSPESSSPSCVRNHCTSCHRHLHDHEFPNHLPSKHCTHANDLCVYCLHTAIQAGFKDTGWERVKCPRAGCGKVLDEGEARNGVLVWMQEGMG